MPLHKLFITWLLFFSPGLILASHLRAGEITYKQLSCNSLQYEITLTLYTNTGSLIAPGQGNLAFGDGTSTNLDNMPVIALGQGIGVVTYKVVHTYVSAGNYFISYTEPNRNIGIVNFLGSGMTRFYVDTKLTITAGVCNQPVQFSISPIDRACKGILFTHNPGAFDADGDSLSYQIFIPKKDANTSVDDYKFPNNSQFYSGLNYLKANEAKNGPPVFFIDAITGTLTWDAPGMLGQFEVAIRVSEWRKIGSDWVNLGYVNRDMQVIVEDCNNTRPYLSSLSNLCVKPGDNVSKIIRGFDNEFDRVKIDVITSENFKSSPPVISGSGIVQSTKAPSDTARIKFNWNITCELVRNEPYKFVFKITDLSTSVPLVTFATWEISVIAAAPEFQSLNLNIATKVLRIEWKPYPCPGATIEVWRRVDGSSYVSDQCRRGIPAFLGFQKIGGVPADNFFNDSDLDPGAKYCYRLLAVFQSGNNQSVVSDELCINPIVIDAPVMTNVSVNKTHESSGEILVRWTSPFQIDKIQFPPPYQYQVLRIKNNDEPVSVFDHLISDSTFMDAGLNTNKDRYGYKVIIYSPNGLSQEHPVDTSALAFYPRLEADAQSKSIFLEWDAIVPWSNQSPRFPWHYIYRSELNSPYGLIDSVNVVVSETGFNYLDEGKFRGEGLKANTVYQYKISTRGVYGNPKIKEPLINFSNHILVQTLDSSPPCKFKVAIDTISCADFNSTSECDFKDYANNISWSYPVECGNDVSFYKVFYSEAEGGEYVLLAATSDLSYIHHKTSFSGCYKVIAVDRTGNESEESDPVCKDNCPNVFIPNVFTPGDKNGTNDFFPGLKRAGLSKLEPDKCPRFIKNLEINIFNRWGQKVYTMESSEIESLNEWSGQGENGEELPSGTYFYLAHIEFDTYDPSLREQTIQGWVNLVR